MGSKVAIQFTGGKDSTYQAILVAQRSQEVHLLTFAHSLSRKVDLAKVNAQKLERLFPDRHFVHSLIQVGDLLRQVYEANWLRNVCSYGTWAAAQFCGACRLAMMTRTIEYCVEHGITMVRDGSSSTGFDLCQQPWAFPLLQDFYSEYCIDYQWEVYSSKCDWEMLRFGLHAESPEILYRSQPVCMGGGFLHNIYLRTYFLPVMGREKHESYGRRWLAEHIALCHGYLVSRGVLRAAQARDG